MTFIRQYDIILKILLLLSLFNTNKMNSNIKAWTSGLLCIFLIAFNFYYINVIDVRHFTDDDIISVDESEFQRMYTYLSTKGHMELVDEKCNYHFFVATETTKWDNLKEGIDVPYISVMAWRNGIQTGENFFYYKVVSKKITSAVKVASPNALTGYAELRQKITG